MIKKTNFRIISVNMIKKTNFRNSSVNIISCRKSNFQQLLSNIAYASKLYMSYPRIQEEYVNSNFFKLLAITYIHKRL